MAKFSLDANMDAMLAAIAASTKLYVCSAQPANFAGIAAVMLAEVVITAGDGNGDFVIANGDVSGRKLRVLIQTAVTITNNGTATHVALAVTGSSTLLYVTTCTSQALVNTGTVTVPEWDIEVADPS